MEQAITAPLNVTTEPSSKIRISSIDVLRGIVMIIMALDHIRDFFHISANIDDPLNLETTTPALFFTRFITHYCAPTFVFLSGTSIFLQRARKTTAELSAFLIKRGLWLIFAEFVIISVGWTFSLSYQFIPMQVIWTIGISMVILGMMVWLPFNAILGIGLLIVFGHNLLDIPESAPGYKPGFFMDMIHSSRFSLHELFDNHFVIIAYPFLPWTGLMMLGYCIGKFFAPGFPAARRKKLLIGLGVSALVFFVILRFTEVYGNPYDWDKQKTALYTVFAFLRVHKYPPSLLYMCITIGPALLFLAFFESVRNKFTDAVSIFGRTAFFYYILHLYLIHLLSTIAFFLRGHTFAERAVSENGPPFQFVIPGEGYSLAVVYGVWALVILLLYPLCKWYDAYKRKHKEKWWLSYL